jgi:phosphoribosyl 1,2-cyclic phosphate phosphodiesterase
LIDCTPDLRQQLLDAKLQVEQLQAIFITHKHEDHVGGFEELRPLIYHREKPLHCYLSDETYQSLQKRLYYLWENPHSWIKQIIFHILEETDQGGGSFLLPDGKIGGYFFYKQPHTDVIGYRVGNFAYITDIKTYSTHLYTHLSGINTLVLGMSQWDENNMHFSWKEVIQFIAPLPSATVILTHMSHLVVSDSERAATLLQTASNIRLGYDGLTDTCP